MPGFGPGAAFKQQASASPGSYLMSEGMPAGPGMAAGAAGGGAGGCLSPVMSRVDSSGTTVNSGGAGAGGSPTGGGGGTSPCDSPSLVAPWRAASSPSQAPPTPPYLGLPRGLPPAQGLQAQARARMRGLQTALQWSRGRCPRRRGRRSRRATGAAEELGLTEGRAPA